jgi:anti-sigma factor RsiW
MDRGQEKQAIERKLATCRELAREFPDGEMAQMICELEEELRQELRDLEESAVPLRGFNRASRNKAARRHRPAWKKKN